MIAGEAMIMPPGRRSCTPYELDAESHYPLIVGVCCKHIYRFPGVTEHAVRLEGHSPFVMGKLGEGCSGAHDRVLVLVGGG